MFKLETDPSSLPLDLEKFCYCDTETLGLFGKVRLFQIYQSHFDKVVIFDTYETPLQEIMDALQGAVLVFHNAQYDVTCIKQELGLDYPIQWECTYTASRLKFPNFPQYDLEFILTRILGESPYTKAGLNKKAQQKNDWGGLLFDEDYMYACVDVLYMKELVSKLVEVFDSVVYRLDHASIEAMIQFSNTGLPVNQTTIQALLQDKEERCKEFYIKLKGMNCNSSRQVAEAIGQPSSDDYHLALAIAKGNELATDLRDWRKALKEIDFLKKFDKPRIYGRFKLNTKSGRSSCSDENLQQIPSSLKKAFESDKFFVYADFSNLELRTFCAYVGEEVMYRLFKENVDLHSYTASHLFNVEMSAVSKEQRTIAKLFNFSSLYGAGVKKRIQILLRNTGILLEEHEGKRLAQSWLETFPAVKPWHNENATRSDRRDIGHTALGKPFTSDSFTEFCNLGVQGTGAEVSKVALVAMLTELDPLKLCAFVHDSYTFECDTLDEAKHYAKVVAESMHHAWVYVSSFMKIKDLPMPVTASVGKNWADLQSDKNLISTYSV